MKSRIIRSVAALGAVVALAGAQGHAVAAGIGPAPSAGPSAISTGAFPRTHGIVGNSWFDTSTWKSVACADVTTASPVSYAGTVTGGNSPERLLVPTLTDELRSQNPGPTRVFTMSIKARTAVMLAGRRAAAAPCFDP